MTLKAFFDNYPKKTLGVAVMLISGLLMVFMVLLFCENYLAPWPAFQPEFQPSSGTLERTIMDAFETGSLELVLLIIFLGFFIFQIVLLLLGLRRTDDALLPWKLSATNIILIAVSLLLCYVFNPYDSSKGTLETWGQYISYRR